MARIRSIHPDVHADPKLARATSDAWRLYFGIANQADDFGVVLDAPERLQLQVFAARPDITVPPLVDELVRLGKLARYEDRATGKRYLYCVDWTEEQKISKPSWEKRHPAVDTLHPLGSVEPGGVRGAPGESGGHPEEGKVRGVEGRGEETTTATTPAAVASGESAGADDTRTADAPPASRRSRKPASTPRIPRAPKADPAPDSPAVFMPVLNAIWHGRYGAQMRKGAATVLRPLVVEHGVEKVATHLTVYCAQTLATYAPSVLKFAETFGACAPGGERETSKPALAAVPSLPATASADDVTARREAQALYAALRTSGVCAMIEGDRAKSPLALLVETGQVDREVARALYGACWTPHGGAIGAQAGATLRAAIHAGREPDAIRGLESLLRAIPRTVAA